MQFYRSNPSCMPCSGLSLVTKSGSKWVVMVVFHYVKPELTIMGDIDLSSVELMTILLLPFITMQPCFGTKLIQLSDD